MKNKKLIGFLIVLIFLAVLIVINSTLFTVQTIRVNWLTTKFNIEKKKIDDYTIASNVEKGGSVFLVNKNEISSALEKKYPYLRVVNIETKFPNKLVIHSAERESLFAIQLSQDDYAIVDEMGKVLERCNSSVFAGSELEVKPIRVILENGINILPTSMEEGNIVDNEFLVSVLTQISKSLRESNYIPTTSKGVFRQLTISNTGDNAELAFQTRNGMKIILENALTETTNKFLLGLSQYNKYHQDGVVTGSVVVADNVDYGYYARYVSIA